MTDVRRRRIARLLALAGLTAAAAAVCGPPAGTRAAAARAAPAVCRNLRLTAPVARAWARAVVRARPRLRGLPLRRSRGAFYGRCGATSYGLASFEPRPGARPTSAQQVALQDQPDVLRRRAGERWRDVSDTGGRVACGGRSGFPPALVRVWRLRCGRPVSEGRRSAAPRARARPRGVG